jgi:hypothetical protein
MGRLLRQLSLCDAPYGTPNAAMLPAAPGSTHSEPSVTLPEARTSSRAVRSIEQDLRGSVPPCEDVVRELLLGVADAGLAMGGRAAQAEVAQLEHPVGREQQVGGLQVAVQELGRSRSGDMRECETPRMVHSRVPELPYKGFVVVA